MLDPTRDYGKKKANRCSRGQFFSAAAPLCLAFSLLAVMAQTSSGAVIDQNAPARVTVTGQLSSSSAALGEHVRFWITISNDGDGPIDNVQLEHLDSPGFRIHRRCWDENPAPECGVPTDSPEAAPGNDPDRIAKRLEKGESRTIWGDLEADHANRMQGVVAVIGWSSPSKARSWSSAALGQLASLTEGEKRWSDLRDFVKDVGLPILLLLLSVGFGFYQHHRDKAEEEREHKRDTQEQEQQNSRAQLSQTWNQMLPESHRVARDHYLPLWGAAQQMIMKVDAFVREEESKMALEAHRHCRMAFYHMMMFAWHARESNWKIGGYYFKNRVGEKLVYGCYMKYFTLYGDDERTITHRSHLLDLLNARTTMASFLALNETPGYSQTTWELAWQDFCGWLKGSGRSETVLFLKGFIAILDYESNRPYQLWYGSNYPMQTLEPPTTTALEGLADQDMDIAAIRGYIQSARKGN